ncbi:cytochrome P450 [Microbacterium sp. No. 7]|uniref:cytochrome P450 n=1 Tax=Microbacterium sp. No. 7 TaxID=1714373 RepID=UPI0006D124A0|nr:cytochrome P450 [Microbacterium sp. No. 7]ALJ21953.1 cytochrome [Microbacterium sp. No. 7]
MTKTTFSDQRTDPYDPPEQHLRLQTEQPVAELDWPSRGGAVWAVTKLEDVRAMLANTRFSSDRANPAHPAHLAYSPDTHAGQIIAMDPPEHSVQRGRIMGEFTVKKVAAMRPRVEEIVADTIDAMLASGSGGDLVTLLSLPVPSMVIADMLGVPYEDHEFFQNSTATFTEPTADLEERAAASTAIRDYIATLVDDRIENPGDDILSRQLAAGAPRDEAIGLGFLLLIAGHETTSNMISLAVMTLLDRPELLQQLRDDPKLVPGAVEELLRYFTIAEVGGMRLALDDLEVHGVTIPSGSVVYALANTANRDPDVFPDPHRIDFTRGARNHVAFGFGPHQCLGQNVARLELEIVLDALIRRVPTLRLAVPVSELRFKTLGNYGLYELPVEW